VKICGLTTAEAVDAAVEAKADAIGFVFYPASPRHLEPAAAARLAERIPAGIERFAVTRHPDRQWVQHLWAEFRPDVLQTDAADFSTLTLPTGLATLPVLRDGGVIPEHLPARCLYESAESGQGHRADWLAAVNLARRTQLVLAGGLNPDSVTQAVRSVRPYGVDVSSGVESAPGRKDPKKIAAFVAAARAAAVRPEA
jgi:phosphoribosylanthranilate isomerase